MHKSSDLSTGTKKNGSSDSSHSHSHSYTSIRTTTTSTFTCDQNSLLDDEENHTLATRKATTTKASATKDDEASLEQMNELQNFYLRYNNRTHLYLFLVFFVAPTINGLILFVNIQKKNMIENSLRDKDVDVDEGNDRDRDQNQDRNHHPWPHMGHKLQINASAFTVNDYDCMQLDTGNWPSERVHCELVSVSKSKSNINNNSDVGTTDLLLYDFVVEHFDDEHCQTPNEKLPTVRHTSSGCFYYETYNHSYHDLCHENRTFTVSAFEGEGCIVPLDVTAVNLLPEDV